MRTVDNNSDKYLDIEIHQDGTGLIEAFGFEPDYPILSIRIDDMKTFVNNLVKLEKISNDWWRTKSQAKSKAVAKSSGV